MFRYSLHPSPSGSIESKNRICLPTDRTPCPKVFEIFLRIPYWSSWYPRLNKLKTCDNSVVTWSSHTSWFLLNSIHNSGVACTVNRSFWITASPAPYLSHVVYYVLRVVTNPLHFPGNGDTICKHLHSLPTGTSRNARIYNIRYNNFDLQVCWITISEFSCIWNTLLFQNLQINHF